MASSFFTPLLRKEMMFLPYESSLFTENMLNLCSNATLLLLFLTNNSIKLHSPIQHYAAV